MKRFPLEWFTSFGLNTIGQDSPQPDTCGRYIDRQGRIFEWDDDEDCWSHTFATGHGLAVDLWEWEDIDPRDLPWTELYA